MSDNTKAQRPTYMKDNSARNAKRQALRVEADVYRVCNRATARGNARALRRSHGDLHPVNPMASMQQHPTGNYASSVGKEQFQKDCDAYLSRNL